MQHIGARQQFVQRVDAAYLHATRFGAFWLAAAHADHAAWSDMPYKMR